MLGALPRCTVAVGEQLQNREHVGAAGYLRTMSWYGAGRFLRPGDSAPGESVAESSIFAILNFVFGTGVRNHRVGGRYELRADMLFEIGERAGHLLVIEYDGAYWHRDREETDLKKICETRSLSGHHDVMRLRQEPLRRLHPADVSFPRRADAMTCARLALLHIAHRSRPFLPGEDTLRKIYSFLAFGAIPLSDAVISCDACCELNYVLQQHGPDDLGHRDHRPRVPRRGHRPRISGHRYFLDSAVELSRLGEGHESAWRPGDREWEREEGNAYLERGFRERLQQLRGAERPPAPSTQVGSTIPLLTKRASGWVEGS